MNGLRFAISFLTILPAAPRDTPINLASARAYFPLVGLLIGLILAIIDYFLTPSGPFYRSAAPLLEGAVVVTALIVLTRALHLDGFMDSCDALLGGFTRERRLEILRDPHVGAFAVIGVVGLLLLKFTAIVSLPPPTRIPMLVLFPCLSRWSMLLAMELYPYVRPQGLGTAFLDGRSKKQVFIGFITALAASLLLTGVPGIILLAAATAVGWGLGRWAAGLLGGLTGDIYGAVNETAEVAVLVLAVLAITGAPFTSIFDWEIHLWAM
jgi:adenosylcobinamide-GDP ribazoletransferase